MFDEGDIDYMLMEAGARVQALIEERFAEALLRIKKDFERDRRSAGQRYRHHFAWLEREKRECLPLLQR